MIHRSLGNTGLSVSAVSLGGVAFGGMYGPITMEQGRGCLHRAMDAGINLLDASPFYGETRSETVLGELLAGHRDRILLCSKAGRNTRRDFDFSPAAMRRSVEASLKRLRTDYLDILIAHDIEFADDFEKVFTETAAVLHDLKKEGKCRFVGMSCLPPGLLKQAIERCELDVVISYCKFNLQNATLISDLLPTAERHGVGILNASPLSMGLLTNQGPQDWHPASDTIKKACQEAAELCRARGSDISFLGMQYCFREPRIASTVSGAARAEELDVNLKALEQPIDESLLSEVMKVLEPVADDGWPSGNWKGA